MVGLMSSEWRVSVSRESRGFTLIELLVVIAIMGILMGIMMPSLSKARELARRANCLANLHRLGRANFFYLNDNGVFPPVRLKNNADGTPYVNSWGAQAPRWQWFLSENAGPVIDPAPYGGLPFGDSQTTTMTNNYFVCPSLTGPYAKDIRNGAYGYNYQYLGDSRSVVGGVYTNYPVRESGIRATSQTILFADSRGGDSPHGKHSYTLDPPKLAASQGVTTFGPTAGGDGPIGHSPVETRHGDTGCAVFVDGHAAAMNLEQFGYRLNSSGVVIPGDPAGSNRMWSGKEADE